MVTKNNFLYLFIGQDSLSKDAKLRDLKKEFLVKEIEDFNLDVLYARELTLKGLQEKLLFLPVKTKKRIILIKDALSLKEEIREFILKYLKSPKGGIVLILDISHQNPGDDFISRLARSAQVYRFSEAARLDAFTLSRQIEQKRADTSLKILNQLLENGEKPERIMGGLRYALEKDALYPLEKRKMMRLLLNCDIEIKRGKLQAQFALEKLVVGLCGLRQP